ncbi:MAG: hypothetical protein J1F66_02575 [Clostridiales bacterium]|nr:hypothetical protein [Clostridiales bacterium]
MSNKFEINGNLYEYQDIEIFEKTICEIRTRFQSLFGEEVLDRLPLYVDNSTKGGGYTPITDVVLHQHITIKLCIGDFSDVEEITYQFAHEMCHFTYRCLLGINKKNADIYEESICSAMALCFLNGNCRNFSSWCKHVRTRKYEGYRKGYDIAFECNFDTHKLRDKILMELDRYQKIAF